MKDYLTIKEFAELKGVSKTAVYKRLNTTLKPHLTVINGVKHINRKALDEEVTPANSTNTVNFKPTVEPTVESGAESNFLKIRLTEKEEQINKLNEQIKELTESNKEKDKFIQELSLKLVELTQQSHILLQNNQVLLSDKTTITKEQNINDVARAGEVEETEKKSLFKRLFRQ